MFTEIFTRLAEAYVRQSMQSAKHNSPEEDNLQPSTSLGNGGTNVATHSVDPGLAHLSNASQNVLLTPPPHGSDQPFIFDDLEDDQVTLLNFLSHLDLDSSFMASSTGSRDCAIGFDFNHCEVSAGYFNCAPVPIRCGLENTAQN